MLRPPGTPPCGSQLTEIFGKTVTGQRCDATLVKHSNGDHDIVYGTPGGQNQRIFSNAGFAASQWVPILPAQTAAPQFGLPWPRFRSPRIEPDVRISRTQPCASASKKHRPRLPPLQLLATNRLGRGRSKLNRSHLNYTPRLPHPDLGMPLESPTGAIVYRIRVE